MAKAIRSVFCTSANRKLICRRARIFTTPDVYAKGKENFQKLISQGALKQDSQPCFYLYRQIMGEHTQVGLVAAASCEEYLDGIIKKHEFTRPDKEDDRVRHIETLNSQTGPVFLTYRATPDLDAFIAKKIARAQPDIDFTAPDGVRHSAWVISRCTRHRNASNRSSRKFRFSTLPMDIIAARRRRGFIKSRNGAGKARGF